MQAFTWIFAMWDYVFVLTCARDVASRGASDSLVKLKPSIITYVKGTQHNRICRRII